MSSIAEAYRKIAKIVNNVDEAQESIGNFESRIKSLTEDLTYYQERLINTQNSIDSELAEAKRIADSVGIPFEYSPPSSDEWDSSDSWNSSSQYC